MPIVDFDSVEKFFREKTSQNLETKPATSTTNPEAVADDSGGAERSNIPSQPANPVSTRNRMRAPYGGITSGPRTGFILTSDYWRNQNRALQLHAGPSAVSWQLPLRAQNEENKAGHARYAQSRTSRRGTGDAAVSTQVFFDFPRLSIQFQAGNLMPINGFQNEVTAPYGLQDFYRFMELLNQPPILPNGTNEGAHNYVWIFYTSLQFPQMVIKGYFEPDGVSWEDNAESPTMLQWTAAFLAHDMTPNPWEADDLLTAYTDFMRDTVRIF